MTKRLTLALTLLFVSVAFIASGAASVAAPDITGKWTSTFETPIGEMSYTYEFGVKEGKLTGKIRSSFGISDVTEGTVEGDKVWFVELLDGSIRIEYTGKITSADEIAFSRKVGDFGTETLVAKRVKP